MDLVVDPPGRLDHRLHLIEITLWAVFYVWQDAMPDLQSALYFSAVTYTTTGYGDLVLPREWQLLGGVEPLTGILMCGWSTGFFFAVFSRILRRPLPNWQRPEALLVCWPMAHTAALAAGSGQSTSIVATT